MISASTLRNQKKSKLNPKKETKGREQNSSDTENRKAVEKINKTGSSFLEKNSKINTSLVNICVLSKFGFILSRFRGQGITFSLLDGESVIKLKYIYIKKILNWNVNVVPSYLKTMLCQGDTLFALSFSHKVILTSALDFSCQSTSLCFRTSM